MGTLCLRDATLFFVYLPTQTRSVVTVYVRSLLFKTSPNQM
jgi:hypothetical protein